MFVAIFVVVALFAPAAAHSQSLCQTPLGICQILGVAPPGTQCWCQNRFTGLRDFGRVTGGPVPMPPPPPRLPAPSTQETVQHFHFNPKMEPAGLFDIAAECRRNDVCWFALEKAGEAYGIPMTAIGVAIDQFYEQEGEITRANLVPPRGSKFCRAQILEIHASPKPEKYQKSWFQIELDSSVMNLTAVTPKQDLFEVTSEIDVLLVMTSVPLRANSDSRGRCTIPRSGQQKASWRCHSDDGGRNANRKCERRRF